MLINAMVKTINVSLSYLNSLMNSKYSKTRRSSMIKLKDLKKVFFFLVGRELGNFGKEIAALGETCFEKVGEIKEFRAGYTFF